MNNSTYIVYDYESSGIRVDFDCIIEIGAVPLHPRTLKTYKDNIGNDIVFHSLMRIPDDKLEIMQSTEEGKKNLAKALEINHKTLEEVQAAPSPDVVWPAFVNFIHSFSSRPSDAWRNPIPIGWNNTNFDDRLTERYAKEYGNVDSQGNSIVFNKTQSIDLMRWFFLFFENSNKLNRFSLDAVRKFLGLEHEGLAHTALFDAISCQHIFQRLMSKQRIISTKVILEDCFKIHPLDEDER